ncbi:MAG TPA: acetate/propionate family kinase [Candidatus Latescibacteria bacterium]|jgi:acetate kinase|nr:acetate kinase [Gemmatimonadaceae bacterium]MDP6017235.1 acetate/propionate family kinase [Candidatus Latescibacterota bacterium]HJP30445.1 acetate/propionate family kinase [Candidatus Latescibacterota bacterium]|tara:strand:- start:67 stop:1272 length:1206 start_codon:yes stop_codon:yes gene_type:complete
MDKTEQMKILVANLGSTTFKYKVFDMPAGQVLAQGGMDRIGEGKGSVHKFRLGAGDEAEQPCSLPDHAAAIDEALLRLTGDGGPLTSVDDLDAVGFKTVHARAITGVVELDEDVIGRMEDFFRLAPAHNPAYVAAIRQFERVAPAASRVGCFEPAFHGNAPLRRQLYAVPWHWYEDYGIRRYGFHGASHRYAAEKVIELEGTTQLRHINCHLGGSSSLCAVKDGVSRGASHGLSPQGGVPQNNRIGDLDPYALQIVCDREGVTLDRALEICAAEGGMLGLSGVSNDMRDIEEKAAAGDQRCALAIEVFTSAIRDYLGAYVIELGGVDVISFTGGIGEHSSTVRGQVLSGLEFLGVEMDRGFNDSVHGEGILHAESSAVRLRVLRTDEELIVARQTHEQLTT